MPHSQGTPWIATQRSGRYTYKLKNPRDCQANHQKLKDRYGTDSSSKLPKGKNLAKALILRFWPTEPWDNKCLLFKPQFVVFSHGSPRKLIESLTFVISSGNFVALILTCFHLHWRLIIPEKKKIRMIGKVKVLVAQLALTLRPHAACQAPLSMEFSRQEYWSRLPSVLPMNIHGWFPLGWTGLISLKSKGLSRVFSSTTIWKNQFLAAQTPLWANSHIWTWLLGKKNLSFN